MKHRVRLLIELVFYAGAAAPAAPLW